MTGSYAFLVQAVAGVAKQQLADASEAAVKEKEAAVSKCIQSVQRRASKEALQQVCCFAFTFASALHICCCHTCTHYIKLVLELHSYQACA